MISIKRLIKFTSLTHKFQQVKRVILVKNEDRLENDLEHSAQLSLIAWYLVKTNKLKLNLELVLKYALAHDLVEIYAGDVNFYDFKKKKNKSAREHKAALRLKSQFPEFTELHKLIKNYELKKDDESKFVYALDKIIPPINIFLDKGRNWHVENVTLDMTVTHKTPQVSKDPTIHKYFEDLVKILKKHKNYFPKIDSK